MEQIEYVWADKKRHLGLPVSFTTYSLSVERLFVQRGFFVVHHDQTMLYRVQDIHVSISLWQRFFGVGTITVISNDKSVPDMKLENVQDPLYVKELIHQLVEAVRIKKDIKPSEFMR